MEIAAPPPPHTAYWRERAHARTHTHTHTHTPPWREWRDAWLRRYDGHTHTHTLHILGEGGRDALKVACVAAGREREQRTRIACVAFGSAKRLSAQLLSEWPTHCEPINSYFHCTETSF